MVFLNILGLLIWICPLGRIGLRSLGWSFCQLFGNYGHVLFGVFKGPLVFFVDHPSSSQRSCIGLNDCKKTAAICKAFWWLLVCLKKKTNATPVKTLFLTSWETSHESKTWNSWSNWSRGNASHDRGFSALVWSWRMQRVHWSCMRRWRHSSASS